VSFDRVKYVVLLLALVSLSGCQTDSQGNRETAWEAMKRWEDSMTETEARLQAKNYNN
jgi:hypothetical protein